MKRRIWNGVVANLIGLVVLILTDAFGVSSTLSAHASILLTGFSVFSVVTGMLIYKISEKRMLSNI